MKKIFTITMLIALLTLTACNNDEVQNNDLENEDFNIEGEVSTEDNDTWVNDFVDDESYPVSLYDGTVIYARSGIGETDVEKVLDINQNIDLDEIDVVRNNTVFHFAGNNTLAEATRDFDDGYWDADNDRVPSKKFAMISISPSKEYSTGYSYTLYVDNRTDDYITTTEAKLGYMTSLNNATVNGITINNDLKITDFVDVWGKPFAAYAYFVGYSPVVEYLWRFNDGYIIISSPSEDSNKFKNIYLYAEDSIYNVELDSFESCLRNPEFYE